MMPRPNPSVLLAAATLPLLAAACAGNEASSPSLAPRPVEHLLAAPPVVAGVVAVPDAALDARVAASVAAADEGARRFDTALAAARAAAQGTGATVVGSEPWFAAQQALTALGAARAPVATALADLDRERIEAAARAAPVVTTRLDTAHARVAALAQEEDAAYDMLAAALPNE